MSDLQINLQLYPRQALALHTDAQEVLYGGAAGGGKALSVSTPIPTPAGWITMGEVKVGDQVLDENGKPCNVIAATDVMYGRPCYRIVFDDGTEVIADANHQWLTSTVSSRQSEARSKRADERRSLGLNVKTGKPIDNPQYVRFQTHLNIHHTVKTTSEIAETVRTDKQGNRINHAVEVPKPLRLPEADLPIHPYLLGLWLGDGGTLQGCLYFPPDKEPCLKVIESLGYSWHFGENGSNKTARRVWVDGLHAILDKVNLLGQKHIPVQYLRASYEQRLELLKGLMDSDGTCCASSGKSSFSNVNKRLIDDVYELACTLGFKPWIRIHHEAGCSEKHGYNMQTAYEVGVTTSTPIFHLERKRSRQIKEERGTQRWRYIVSVEPVESVPVRCIQVDSPSSLFLVAKSFIPTHNSHLMRVAAIIWASQIPGVQIYFFRRQFVDLEANHLNGPSSFPVLLGPLIKSGHCTWNKSKYQFQFYNGSSIKLAHVQKESDVQNYLGAEIHILIIDELSQFTPQIYRFLRSRLRMVGVKVPPHVKGKFPKILCGSNPGGPAHSFMKMQWISPAAPEQIWRAPDDDGGLHRQFIPAKVTDNPALLEQDPQYINRLRGLGDPALVKAYLEGSFDIVSGGMFDDLWSNTVHVLEPFPIPKRWTVDRSFDWGSSRPFSVNWYAESDGSAVTLADGRERHFPLGTVIQIGEWYGWNGKPNEGLRFTPSQVAEGIVAIENQLDRKIIPGPADSSIFDLDAYGTSIASTMASNGVEWTRADKSPGSRTSGWTLIRERLRNSLASPMELPGFFVFRNCSNMIRLLPEAVRADNNPEDLNPNFEDHCLDALRYRLQVGSSVLKKSRLRLF